MSSTSGELSSYGELAEVLGLLPVLLREARRFRRLSLRAAAVEVGCAAATLLRIEEGQDCALSNAVAVLRWLDRRELAVGAKRGAEGDQSKDLQTVAEEK